MARSFLSYVVWWTRGCGYGLKSGWIFMACDRLVTYLRIDALGLVYTRLGGVVL